MSATYITHTHACIHILHMYIRHIYIYMNIHIYVGNMCLYIFMYNAALLRLHSNLTSNIASYRLHEKLK